VSTDFAAFELAGWRAVPEAYDSGFARLTTPQIGVKRPAG
jgi:hypothetical protein